MEMEVDEVPEAAVIMNFYCEDCKVSVQSYTDWVNHLVTTQHQLISATKIQKWVTEKNPSCIVLASMSTREPLEVALRFSKFGFLWNFYAHPDHKFYIILYDNEQTAGFALRKVNEHQEPSANIQVRPLTDLTSEDWVALFPPPTSFSATIQTQSFLAAGVLPSVGYEVPSSKIPKLDTAGSYLTQSDITPTNIFANSAHKIAKQQADQVPSTSFSAANTYQRQYQDVKPTPSELAESMHSVSISGQMNLMNPQEACFDEQLNNFFETMTISLKDLEKIRSQLLPILSEHLQRSYPGSSLYLLDNFQGGPGNIVKYIEINIADIELQDADYSEMKSRRDPTKQMQLSNANRCSKLVVELHRKLQMQMETLGPTGCCHSLKLETFAQYSNVKFTNPISPQHKFMLTTCVTAPEYSRRRHFKLIDFFIQFYPNVRALLCFVHYWSHQNVFMQFQYQRIKDYVLSVMCIIFLQKKKVLPTLQQIQVLANKLKIDNFSQSILLEKEILDNKEICEKLVMKVQTDFFQSNNEIFNILELTKEFFEFYGKEDFLNNNVICTWTADFIPRSKFKLLATNPSKLDSMPLCIESLFDPNLNIGRSTKLGWFKKIAFGYRQTASKLYALLHNQENNIMSVFERVKPGPEKSANGKRHGFKTKSWNKSKKKKGKNQN